MTEADCVRVECMIGLLLSKGENLAPSPSGLGGAIFGVCNFPSNRWNGMKAFKGLDPVSLECPLHWPSIFTV